MNLAAKNADRIQPQERVELLRRETDRRPPWAGIAAVFALCLLAYQSVQHRDELVALKEQHAAELAEKDREIALYKPVPKPMACRDYTTVPYDQALDTACIRTITKL